MVPWCSAPSSRRTSRIIDLAPCDEPLSFQISSALVFIDPLPLGGTNWVYNDRPKVVPGVFAQLAPVLKPGATIAEDGEASYPKWIRQALPGARKRGPTRKAKSSMLSPG